MTPATSVTAIEIITLLDEIKHDLEPTAHSHSILTIAMLLSKLLYLASGSIQSAIAATAGLYAFCSALSIFLDMLLSGTRRFINFPTFNEHIQY